MSFPHTRSECRWRDLPCPSSVTCPQGWCTRSCPSLGAKKLSHVVHRLHHPGVTATAKLVAQRFVWPGMSSQVTTWAQQCLTCQSSKVSRHTKPRCPCSPSPPSSSTMSILTSSDIFLHPRDARTSSLSSTPSPGGLRQLPFQPQTRLPSARAFIANWVSTFGLPAYMTSDGGPQFTSTVWKAMCASLGVHLKPTTAYHPQANGLVEHLHRQLKSALTAREAGTSWADHLPWVILGIPTTFRPDLGTSLLNSP